MTIQDVNCLLMNEKFNYLCEDYYLSKKTYDNISKLSEKYHDLIDEGYLNLFNPKITLEKRQEKS